MTKSVWKEEMLTQLGKESLTQASGPACADTSQALEEAKSCTDHSSRWMRLEFSLCISAPSFFFLPPAGHSVALWSKTQTWRHNSVLSYTTLSKCPPVTITEVWVNCFLYTGVIYLQVTILLYLFSSCFFFFSFVELKFTISVYFKRISCSCAGCCGLQ